ncbi:hypothetical protein BDR03DRAFT_1018977 [Suillus americanus]|nr:hypothetical protein BDR03DRAFT_1018977 [Suillus americanus]
MSNASFDFQKCSPSSRMQLKAVEISGRFRGRHVAALIFDSKNRSYKELPIRMAEFGIIHPNESSGALTGLTNSPTSNGWGSVSQAAGSPNRWKTFNVCLSPSQN